MRAVRTESEMSAVGEQRARGHLNVKESMGLHQTECWTLGFETALPQKGFFGPNLQTQLKHVNSMPTPLSTLRPRGIRKA